MAKRKPMKITDDELVARINSERSLADTQSESFLSDQRINSNYSFVNIDTTFTTPTTGMSGVRFFFTPSVVNTLTMYLSKIFCSNKETIKFNPSTKVPEALIAAGQLSQMANNVLHRQNNGFEIMTEMFRSAAVNKNAVAKVVWDEKQETYEEVYEDVSEQAILQVISEKEAEGYSVEVVGEEITVEAIEETVADEFGNEVIVRQTEQSADYTLRLTRMKGGIDISVLPPEEFIINEDTTAINSELTRFVGHRKEIYLSDAMAMFPEAKEEDFGQFDNEYLEYEKAARHGFDGTYTQYGNAGGTGGTEKVELVECWIRADRDRDGFAEWRHCFVSGANLLMDEEWFGDLPFASFTFFPVPHKFYGLSVYDRLKSYEETATGLMRADVDMARLKNTFRLFAKEGSVDKRNLQSGKPGVIGVSNTFDPNDVLVVPSPQGAGNTTQLMQELRQQVIADVGIDPVSGQISTDIEKSGNDAAKTAMALDNASIKTEGYARSFADGTLRDILWLIVNELIRNKDEQFVEDLVNAITPDQPFFAGQLGLDKTLAKTDLTATIGLGHQTGQQKIEAAVGLTQMVQQLEQNPSQVQYFLVLEALKGFGYENAEAMLGSFDEYQQKAQMAQQQVQAQVQAAQVQAQTAQQQVQLQQQQLQFAQQMEQQKEAFRQQIEQMKAEAEIAQKLADTSKKEAEATVIPQRQALEELKAQEEINSGGEINFAGV